MFGVGLALATYFWFVQWMRLLWEYLNVGNQSGLAIQACLHSYWQQMKVFRHRAAAFDDEMLSFSVKVIIVMIISNSDLNMNVQFMRKIQIRNSLDPPWSYRWIMQTFWLSLLWFDVSVKPLACQLLLPLFLFAWVSQASISSCCRCEVMCEVTALIVCCFSSVHCKLSALWKASEWFE